MLKISRKSRELPLSPIRKLVPFAEKAQAKGTKIYHLNIGQPDIKTPKIALDAIRNHTEEIIPYTHSAGIPSYRRKLVEYYHRVGINIDLSDLIVTVGGSEAIMIALTICTNPGDEVLLPEPFYANYNTFALESDAVIVPVHSSIEENFALPAIEEFEKQITPRTKAILICNPNNPTGYLYSKEEILKLRDIVKKHNLYLISDEVYREFCYDGEEHFSALNVEGIEENVIVIDSVSKRYSMCGARIGTLVSRNKEVMAMALKFAQARLSPPYLAQVAAEAAVDTPQSYFDEVYKEYIERRDCLVSELNKIEGVYTPCPKGAFYTITRFPVDDCDKFAQWLLEEFSWDNETVMIAPASGFYATKRRGHNEARIAYVLKKEDLMKSCNILREALKVYPGRTI